MKRMGLLLGLAVCLMAAPSAVASDYMVRVENYDFQPSEIYIFTGDTVGWRNVNGIHSTTSDDGLWDSGVASAPWGFAYTFTASGDYYYYCTVHGAPGGIGQSGIVHVYNMDEQ
jgi:plastocyanin